MVGGAPATSGMAVVRARSEAGREGPCSTRVRMPLTRSLEHLALEGGQARLILDQRLGGVDAVVLAPQFDEGTDELAQLGCGGLAQLHHRLGVPGPGFRPGCRQLPGDVVEVDLEVMGQEVSCGALTSRKFDI